MRSLPPPPDPWPPRRNTPLKNLVLSKLRRWLWIVRGLWLLNFLSLALCVATIFSQDEQRAALVFATMALNAFITGIIVGWRIR